MTVQRSIEKNFKWINTVYRQSFNRLIRVHALFTLHTGTGVCI
jgi:hypothetical protein